MKKLKYFYGPMDCGKSTLALQIDYNLTRQGKVGLRLTCLDRSGDARISTRIGLDKDAQEVGSGRSILELVEAGDYGYVIADEAQFYTPEQIEELCLAVDDLGIDVYAFGIATDFRSEMFPGSKRLFELADELMPLQVEAPCWCGEAGSQNARVVDDVMVKEGDQVVVGDTDKAQVRYQVVCRKHFVRGELGS